MKKRIINTKGGLLKNEIKGKELIPEQVKQILNYKMISLNY